jgi:hypothetical protein
MLPNMNSSGLRLMAFVALGAAASCSQEAPLPSAGSDNSSSAGTGSSEQSSASNPSASGSNGSTAITSATTGTSAGSSTSNGSSAVTSATTGTSTTSGSTAGDGGSSLDPKSIVPDLDGFYWEGTCVGTRVPGGKNCPLDDQGATCPSSTTYANRGIIRTKSFMVHGTAGTQYTVNFEVRGVAGTRCYTGGTAASTAAPSADGANNGWYVGGVQSGDSIWNTYELHVVNPPVTGAANTYYFNNFPMNPNWCQQEATYQIKYTASFPVMGNSTMQFVIHDSNCQAQENCGSNTGATTCDAPRTIDLTGMNPPPPTSFHQPPTNVLGSTTYYPQWLYFVVSSITSP